MPQGQPNRMDQFKNAAVQEEEAEEGEEDSNRKPAAKAKAARGRGRGGGRAAGKAKGRGRGKGKGRGRGREQARGLNPRTRTSPIANQSKPKNPRLSRKQRRRQKATARSPCLRSTMLSLQARLW